ncbi:hypothetical protein Droror1_Dr00007589 [Drosera rotundifolia]
MCHFFSVAFKPGKCRDFPISSSASFPSISSLAIILISRVRVRFPLTIEQIRVFLFLIKGDGSMEQIRVVLCFTLPGIFVDFIFIFFGGLMGVWIDSKHTELMRLRTDS